MRCARPSLNNSTVLERYLLTRYDSDSKIKELFSIISSINKKVPPRPAELFWQGLVEDVTCPPLAENHSTKTKSVRLRPRFKVSHLIYLNILLYSYKDFIPSTNQNLLKSYGRFLSLLRCKLSAFL